MTKARAPQQLGGTAACRKLASLPFTAKFAVVVFLYAGPCLGMGCKPSPNASLGPTSSFALFTGIEAGGNSVTLKAVKGTEGASAQVAVALADGFAAELLRTAFSTQQYIANSQPSARAKAWATDAIPFVVGLDRPGGPAVGAALTGSWMGGAVMRPQTVWIGLPGDFVDSRAVVPLVASRIATFVAVAAETAGEFSSAPSTLANAYARAQEVVAHEWRPNPTAAGVASTKLQPTAAALFAGVRENRFVLDSGKRLRSAADLLTDPHVAATVFYRWFQDKQLMKRVASDKFYAPLKDGRVPAGFSVAAVLGPFRNLQMKVLGTWIAAARAGTPPANIADLVSAYGRQFPEERAAVLRIFLATTFGATAKAGGVSPRSQDAQVALAELAVLADDVISGKTPLVLPSD